MRKYHCQLDFQLGYLKNYTNISVEVFHIKLPFYYVGGGRGAKYHLEKFELNLCVSVSLKNKRAAKRLAMKHKMRSVQFIFTFNERRSLSPGLSPGLSPDLSPGLSPGLRFRNRFPNFVTLISSVWAQNKKQSEYLES